MIWKGTEGMGFEREMEGKDKGIQWEEGEVLNRDRRTWRSFCQGH